MRWLALLLLAATLRAQLPTSVESLRPAMQDAERKLQDASLELEAARLAAAPLQKEVTDARSSTSWWGRWVLKRRLGALKAGLDKVEEARAAQASAREELSLLLTGADEELSAALEASLALRNTAGKPEVEKWASWWRQKRAWQQRLDTLAPEQGALNADAGHDGEAQRIRQEARSAQWQREGALLDALQQRQALTGSELRSERERLKRRYQGPAGAKA